MNPPLQLVGYGPVAWLPVLPQGWNGKILPASQSFTYQGELGNIVIQQYRSEHWSLCYGVFRFLKKMVLHWKEEAALCSRFVLQGDLHYRGEGKRITVKQGTVNLFWAPGRESHATFSRNQEYIIFRVHFAPELVRQLLPQFPAKGLPPEHQAGLIEKEWNKVLNDIFGAPYDDNTLRFYFENKVREILLSLLLQPGAGIRFEGLTAEEISKVHEVDRLILKDITSWLHISDLAKKVALSEFKLKLAFKRVIGMNMFERLREARLEKARKLLLETDHQVKVIYSKVGYKSLSGFEEAFREKYGLPPLQYRKKYQPRG